ncbi:hypothetical protein ACFV06_41240, partial [Streptomyces sp. NPDC059618]|uniref:hypothetical protein n=1 Tax=Streptomyces sp. NPDC059618 TaxID=3346887 RepID=UPI0036ABE99D
DLETSCRPRSGINRVSVGLIFVAGVLILADLIGIAQGQASPLLLLLPVGLGFWGICTLRE